MTLIIFLCLLYFSICDIPVHCEFPSIVGTWTFYMTEKTHNSTCVKRECDLQSSIQTTLTKTITLQSPNLATDESGYIGLWTLIYDQGFEVTLGNEKYFAYFKYTESPQLNAVNFTSHCDETFIGTYHRDVIHARYWGCFYGKKTKNKPQRITYPREYFFPEDDDDIFHNRPDIVEKQNTDPSKLWKAKLYPELEGHYISSGKAGHPDRIVESRKRHKSHIMKSLSGHVKTSSIPPLPKSFDWRNVSGVDFVSPMRAQLMCGSCYTFATLGMLESRQRINTNNQYQPVYSVQDVIDCSSYGQGCDGGFAYLVAKYLFDFGVVAESCDPYRGESSRQCSDELYPCKKQETFVYKYGYVGGYYGASNEVNMMEELVERGPIAVSFSVFPDLKQYQSGVYTCPSEKDEIFYSHHGDGDAPTPKFYPTDHSVLVVGYGVDETTGEKYWIVKNSWSKAWGNEGYFWIRKGTNECNIETCIVYAEIINGNDFSEYQ